MFRGKFVHTVDPKGRISVPARFRDLILASNEDRVMITNFRAQSAPCLDVYPYPAWLSLEESIAQQPQFDPKVQAFMHYYVSSALECQIDKQGRILLPPILREYAKLEDTVMLTGAGKKFQVWNHAAWQDVFDRSEAAIFADPTSFFGDIKI